MITLDSTLGFGKHKKKPISEIPKDYLLRLYKSGIPKDKDPDGKLRIFIEELICPPKKIRKTHETINHIAIKVAEMFCPKEFFISESDAKYRLKFIRSHSTRSEKIPIRAYECDRCGYWHLTSKQMRGKNFDEKVEVENELEYEFQLKDKWLRLINKEENE